MLETQVENQNFLSISLIFLTFLFDDSVKKLGIEKNFRTFKKIKEEQTRIHKKNSTIVN